MYDAWVVPRFDRQRAEGSPLCIRLNPVERGAVKKHAKAKRETISDVVRGALQEVGILRSDMVPEPPPEAERDGVTHGSKKR